MKAPVLSKMHTYADDLNKVRSSRLPQANKSTGTDTPTSAISNTTPVALLTENLTVNKTASTAIPKTEIISTIDDDKNKKVTEAPIKINASASRDATYPAHIITDKKHKRFNLSQALSQSLKDWFAGKVKKQKDRKLPQYTVPAAELRKGVVQHATSITARTTTTDHNSVVAKIKAEKESKQTESALTASTLHRDDVITNKTPTWNQAHTVELDEIKSNPSSSFAQPITIEVEKLAPPTAINTLSIDVIGKDNVELIKPVIPEALLDTTSDWSTNDVDTADSQPELATATFEDEYETKHNPLVSNVRVVKRRNDTYYQSVTENEEIGEVEEIEEDVEIEHDSKFEEEGSTFIDKPDTPLLVPTITFPKITPITPNTFKEEKTVYSQSLPPIKPVGDSSGHENPTTQTRVSSFANNTSPVVQLRESAILQVPSSLTSSKERVAARKQILNQAPTTAKNSFSSFDRWWQLAPYLLGVMFVVTTVGVISYFLFVGNNDNTPADGVISNLPIDNVAATTSNTGTSMAIVQNNTSLTAMQPSSLFKALLDKKSSSGYQVITPLAPNNFTPLTTLESLTLLNRQFTEIFLGNIYLVTFAYQDGMPVLVLHVADSDNAQSGLFDWEKTLGSDLSPWFGSTFSTLNPNSRNFTRFTDTTVNNIDVRTVTDSTNSIRIVYGFANDKTIVLTTSLDSFAKVAEQY